ncbi:o-succinylbenzoate--CoA ligase [Brevibacillus ginsengisoli]|uniref:o-succinylbenzoate--CoA ligase n=1 Tax=Brevibacillus ginsengisoli TaxID=363854 RepID=UPI003CF68B1C
MNGIAHWIDKHAFITPKRVALISEYRQFNYLEMSEEVNRLARMLEARYGLQRGERIGIMAANSIEYLILLFAIAKLGCIAVVLNIRLTPDEITYQLNDSGSRVLVAETTFKREAEHFLTTTGVMELLLFDPEEPSRNHLLEQAAEYSSAHFERSGVDGSCPYIICYTSGTTGRPKGAVLTQENMYWNAVNNVIALDLCSTDKSLTLLPLFHIGGIGLFALPTLFASGCVIVPNRFDPDKTLRMIEHYGATIVMGVPTIYDLLLKSRNFEKTNLRSVRWFYTGGAPCPYELIKEYWDRGLMFTQGFGMTETSPTVFMTPREDYNRKIGSIGKAVMFCDIRVVDDQGCDVKPGEIGELLIKGGNVMQGYWNMPEATAATIRDGWLMTGDLVTQDDEGFVYIVGRKKDMIISGGENIYPLEVEQVIGQLASVDGVAVIGISDDKWGEVPVAVVVVKAGHELSEAEVKSHCLKRLAKYKVPVHVSFVSALPKNATGKIDKRIIKAEFVREEQQHG